MPARLGKPRPVVNRPPAARVLSATGQVTVTATFSLPYEAAQIVTATTSGPWEAQLAISAAVSGPWEANQGVAAVASGPWDATGAVTVTASGPWEAGGFSTGTFSGAWEALKTIAKRLNPTSFYWFAAQSSQTNLANQDSTATSQIFNDARAVMWPNSGTSPYDPYGSGIHALKYDSYAQFQSDVTAGVIDAAITAIIYDPENQASTPSSEQLDPGTTMQNFCDLAHAHGYLAIVTPARSLCQVTGSPYQQQAGETLTDAYLNHGLVGDGALKADFFEIQMQVEETTPSTYATHVQAAISQARAANPNVKILAGLSSSVASASGAFMKQCYDLVAGSVDGFYLTVTTPTASIGADLLHGVLAAPAGSGGPYESLLGVSATISGPWNAIGAVGLSASAPWEAGGQVAATLSLPYDAGQALLATLSGPYEATATARATASGAWEALLGLAAAASGPYEAAGLVSVTISAPWESIALSPNRYISITVRLHYQPGTSTLTRSAVSDPHLRAAVVGQALAAVVTARPTSQSAVQAAVLRAAIAANQLAATVSARPTTRAVVTEAP